MSGLLFDIMMHFTSFLTLGHSFSDHEVIVYVTHLLLSSWRTCIYHDVLFDVIFDVIM